MRTIIQVMGMDSTKFGGLERFMLALADVCENIKFVLVYNSKPKSAIYLEELAKRNIDIIECDCSKLGFIDKIKFAKRLLSYKPNIVHFHFYQNKFIFGIMKMFDRNVVLYQTIHSCIETNFVGVKGVLHKLKHFFNWRIYSMFVNRFLGVSKYVANQLCFWGLKNVETIYPGVDNYSSKEIRIDKGNKKIVTCLGFANPVKGIDVFIKSLPFVECEDFEAWIIGLDEKQEYTVKMKMLAKELGVENRIKWIGVVDNVGEYFKISDVFCQTSRSEALSLAACEALMLGCPVIGSRVGGLPEVAQFTFENEDSLGLANLIDKVLSDVEYRSKLSREAIVKWEQNFKLVDGAIAYCDLYLNI